MKSVSSADSNLNYWMNCLDFDELVLTSSYAAILPMSSYAADEAIRQVLQISIIKKTFKSFYKNCCLYLER